MLPNLICQGAYHISVESDQIQTPKLAKELAPFGDVLWKKNINPDTRSFALERNKDRKPPLKLHLLGR